MSSTRILGPVVSGPKAQMERAAKRSQSYFVWKNSPSRFLQKGKSHTLLQWKTKTPALYCKPHKSTYLFQDMWTTSLSISSANPFSKGSAIIVSLFLLLGVSAKHFKEDVSTTVSQKATTGSATLISTREKN